MIEIKTGREIALLREAGRVVADALEAVEQTAEVGVTPRELDRVAADVIRKAGAVPAFLDYQPPWAPSPFPAVICVSVNDAVVHGIPGSRPLADGDLVSVDCGVFLAGWCGDAAISFVVGEPRRGDPELIAAADAALARGIEAAQPGAQMGDVGYAIGARARSAGYGLLEGHGGHGVGRAMHEDPSVPNEGLPGRGYRLRPGIVLAIEPMLLAGGSDSYVVDPDGWTIRTADGSRAAHREHTIAVTDDGPVVLTAS